MLTETELLAVAQKEAGTVSEPDFEPSVLRLVLKILRHRNNIFPILVDDSGWAATDSLVDAVNANFKDYHHWDVYSKSELTQLVAGNSERLESREGEVRARYGHSYTGVRAGLAAIPPEFLFHLTEQSNLDSILAWGLLPQCRTMVHLTSSNGYLQNLVDENKQQVLLSVDTGLCCEQGQFFYQATEDIWQSGQIHGSALSVCDSLCISAGNPNDLMRPFV